MAHFAQLDENNIVIKVIVIHNNELLDENSQESEEKGIAFCQSLLGGNWIQTSYNKKFRKNFAGIGFKFDEFRNAFIPQQPFTSWVLNENTCQWESPIPYPKDGKHYQWDESTLSWMEVNNAKF